LLGSDGTLDPSFDGGDNINTGNGNGRIVLPITSGANPDVAARVLLTPDGYALIGGHCLVGTIYDFCVHRLGIGGRAGRSLNFYSNGFPTLITPIGSGDDFATAMVQLSDGRFILGGQCANGSVYQFCVARYRYDGTLDVVFDGDSFNGDGKFLVPPNLSNDRLTAMAIQTRTNNPNADGSLVLAGTCRAGATDFFCVTRLSIFSAGAQQCSFDLDGDGRVLATVDGLIMTRVMLGIRGSAVLQGITIDATARRRTWDQISDYLNTQCGMSIF
jgi:Domain of unknown function (DUF5122) beta-propeller